MAEPPPCNVEILGLGSDRLKDADLIILVGLPGSGKSHFAQALQARNRNPKKRPWLRISQDESGSRASCETEIGRPGNERVILDRCNPSAEDRKTWLSLASSTWSQHAICVWFDYSSDLCISRAENRVEHPTLKLTPGSRVRNAVRSMEKMFVRPELGEGFRSIAIVRSFEASMELARMSSPPIEIFKFPRTEHIYNLGAATEDDLVIGTDTHAAPELGEPSSNDNFHAKYQSPFANANSNAEVIITEKIDGANMGISLSSNHTFVIQNRSHYISSKTHAQFSKLTSWLSRSTISTALHAILSSDPYFPERYILFGEWMVAKHSIGYTRLPDLFVAFDLYDRALERWAGRDVLERVVGERGIALVPVLKRGLVSEIEDSLTKDALESMVQGKSAFWDGRVEGVYVKVERGGEVIRRGKVVRGDFIAGNEHWSKGIIKWNSFVAGDL